MSTASTIRSHGNNLDSIFAFSLCYYPCHSCIVPPLHNFLCALRSLIARPNCLLNWTGLKCYCRVDQLPAMWMGSVPPWAVLNCFLRSDRCQSYWRHWNEISSLMNIVWSQSSDHSTWIWNNPGKYPFKIDFRMASPLSANQVKFWQPQEYARSKVELIQMWAVTTFHHYHIFKRSFTSWSEATHLP